MLQVHTAQSCKVAHQPHTCCSEKGRHLSHTPKVTRKEALLSVAMYVSFLMSYECCAEMNTPNASISS